MPRLPLIYCLLISLTMSIHLKGQNNEVMIDLGINSFNEREFGKSYQLFQKALKVDSTPIRLQFYYGLTLYKIHEYQQAKVYLSHVVEKDPSGKVFS